ncbi:MAG: hypothetical protein DME86_02760 [Verrucomicrobia bacterium]|nr:MAG: hypothetical protein DME86_02760 [Verrucomicrobiota bacterium]
MSTIPQTNRSGTGHETRDADVMSLTLLAAILVVGGVIIFIAVSIMMHVLGSHQSPEKNAAVTTLRLQIQPTDDLAKMQAHDNAELSSYGWIDRSKQVVRIPIDRAMQLIVERGLPNVGANQTPLSMMQARSREEEAVEKQPRAHQ